jgi:hypothetical protein
MTTTLAELEAKYHAAVIYRNTIMKYLTIAILTVYWMGGTDGADIVLQITYSGKTFSNQFSSSDTSLISKKVYSLVEMIKKNMMP